MPQIRIISKQMKNMCKKRKLSKHNNKKLIFHENTAPSKVSTPFSNWKKIPFQGGRNPAPPNLAQVDYSTPDERANRRVIQLQGIADCFQIGRCFDWTSVKMGGIRKSRYTKTTTKKYAGNIACPRPSIPQFVDLGGSTERNSPSLDTWNNSFLAAKLREHATWETLLRASSTRRAKTHFRGEQQIWPLEISPFFPPFFQESRRKFLDSPGYLSGDIEDGRKRGTLPCRCRCSLPSHSFVDATLSTRDNAWLNS